MTAQAHRIPARSSVSGRPHRTDDGLYLVRCGADGFVLLVDPRDQDAVLWHTPDGSHRLVPSRPPEGDLDLRLVRVEVMAVAVRLQDLGEDLEAILARLAGVPVGP